MAKSLITELTAGMGSEPLDRRKRSAQATVASLKLRAMAAGFLIGLMLSAAVWAYYFQQDRAGNEPELRI